MATVFEMEGEKRKRFEMEGEKRKREATVLGIEAVGIFLGRWQ